MPYIKKEDRSIYDKDIESLVSKLTSKSEMERTGCFNYIITKLALGITRKKYWCIAMTIGTMLCAILEFYRRFVVGYEDKKVKENGDVYDPYGLDK